MITAITLAPEPMRQVSWIDCRGGLTRLETTVFDVDLYLSVFAAGFHRASAERGTLPDTFTVST